MKYPLLLAVLFSCIGMAPARQTPPSPSDTVQRATAALQTDNASICTPHATGAETPPTLHPDTVQPPARTQFIRPPYLRPGDTVGIVTPARKLSEKADTAKVRERFESWGLKVKFGPHTADREQPYFAGTDAQRAADLQAMIDDPGVKAVVSFQGGYGSVRLLPLIDLDRLREQPKWIVGFSDVTMLHLALGRLGVESLHATMPGKFRFGRDETPEAIVSDEALAVHCWDCGSVSTPTLTRSTARARPADASRAATWRSSARRSAHPRNPTSTPPRCSSSRRSANTCTASTA